MKYTIVASKGKFKNIQTAAYAENDVNWWNDEEYRNQRTVTTAWAATELKNHLRAEAVIVDADDEFEYSDGLTLLLGSSDENKKIKALEDELSVKLTCPTDKKSNSYRIRAINYQGNKIIVLSGSERVGTLYAAYTFLEMTGVHFTEPGEADYTAAKEIPDDFDLIDEPDFKTRGTMSSYVDGDTDFLLWMARNKFNSTTLKRPGHPYATHKKLGINSVEGGHKIFYMFLEASDEYPYCHEIYGGEGKPKDPYPTSEFCRQPSGETGAFTYGDAHPEWYALVDGVRRMKRFPEKFKKLGNAPGDNLCTSNPHAIAELCKRLIEALSDGVWKYADSLNLWPLDNGAWCDCDNCKRLGNYSRRILLLAYEVDKAIKEARKTGIIKRNINIICPAYHETLEVPERDLPEDFDYSTCSVVFYPIERCYVHDIDSPICKETNQTLLGNLLPWTEQKTYKGELVIGEYYNVSTFAAMPFVLTKRIAHDIPFYYGVGARHFHYMHISARDWGFIAVNNFLHGKLIWNTKADANELLDEYFAARYGALAKEMRSLYEKIEAATANCKAYKHYQFLNGKRASLFLALESKTEITEEELFPTNHLKLDFRLDSEMAGPSLKETLDGLSECARTLAEIISNANGSLLLRNLNRDSKRLDFGVRMTEFIYLMCLSALGKKENLDRLRQVAENLEADTDTMAGYDFGSNMENALNASWMAKTYYERFSKSGKSKIKSNGIAL